MTNRAEKQFTIADGSVTLSVEDSGPSKLSPNHDLNIVAIGTDQALTGSFSCYVEYVADGGFMGVTPIGGSGVSIDAALVGSTVSDGDVAAWSFNGSPNRVKIVADTVTGATFVTVNVSQNHG